MNFTSKALNSALSDGSPSHINNQSFSFGFSATVDVPPITLGLLILLANGLVLILVARKRQLRTITNLLLCSLALSDLLTGLISIPLFMTCNILRQSALCIAEDQVLRFTSVSIVCHLVAVSVDRYLAIIYSLRYKSIVTFPRCVSVIFFIWILSSTTALVQLSWMDPVHHDIYQEITPDVIKKENIYDVTSLLLFFLAPLVCMMFMYAKIFLEVSRQIDLVQKQSTPGWEKAKEMKYTERKVVIIFAVMLLVFIVGWLPYFIIRLHQPKFVPHLVIYISIWLRYLTSFLNPCMYVFGKRDFRTALKCRKTQKHQYANLLPLDRVEAT